MGLPLTAIKTTKSPPLLLIPSIPIMKSTHPLRRAETSSQEGQSCPVRGQGRREEAGARGYLFCDAVFRRVDCHELGVFVVLFTAGRGASIDHHLQRHTSFTGRFTARRCAVWKQTPRAFCNVPDRPGLCGFCLPNQPSFEFS